MKGFRAAKLFAAATAVALLVAAAGCSDKASEQFNDAPRGETNEGRADIITFPDGFSNVAAKCDRGNRVYVIFKADNTYGSVAVVPNDPSCAG